MAIDLFTPGSREYTAATAPENSSGSQAPALVAAPRTAEEVAEAVRAATDRGLVARPQATGHGAGGTIGDDTLLIDTSGLDALDIDAADRVASAGTGLTWATVNAAAEQHGLLGLAGSSPSVAIGGYTFGGGLGWLSRPHGTAAGALREVEYVDGGGRIRIAADDAAEAVDREAIHAFRGGGGVGIATRLTFDLAPAPDLHAGLLVWPVEHLDALVAAWAGSLGEVGDAVTSSIAVLHTPPAPPFPEPLRGTTVVHLAVAASTGEAGALPLLDAMRAVAKPGWDTWGPADSAKLASIHLDPPAATPALGDARWLIADGAGLVRDLLAAAVPDDSPVVMLEVRSIGTVPGKREGAATTPAGPFLWHAVAPLKSPDGRPAIDAALAHLRGIAAPADAGVSVGSWVEGSTSVPDALTAVERDRVRAAADAVDPDGRIHRSRLLG